MRDFLQGNRRAKLIDWLKIDSWIDSGLYAAWTGFRDWWSGYSSFFNRFEIKGPLRGLNELACEGLTLSVAGLLVLATFALPSFEIAQGKINLADDFEPALEIVTGIFARRGERDRYAPDHPLNLLWNAFTAASPTRSVPATLPG